MGDTLAYDLPGFRTHVVEGVASVASNAANTVYQPICRVDRAGALKAAYWIPSASQAGHGTNYRTLKIVNLGSAGSGTTVAASLGLTASKAANVAHALTVDTDNNSLSAGDVLAYVTTSAGNGIAVNAANVQLEFASPS